MADTTFVATVLTMSWQKSLGLFSAMERAITVMSRMKKDTQFMMGTAAMLGMTVWASVFLPVSASNSDNAARIIIKDCAREMQ